MSLFDLVSIIVGFLTLIFTIIGVRITLIGRKKQNVLGNIDQIQDLVFDYQVEISKETLDIRKINLIRLQGAAILNRIPGIEKLGENVSFEKPKTSKKESLLRTIFNNDMYEKNDWGIYSRCSHDHSHLRTFHPLEDMSSQDKYFLDKSILSCVILYGKNKKNIAVYRGLAEELDILRIRFA